jgi:hypothetical protein
MKGRGSGYSPLCMMIIDTVHLNIAAFAFSIRALDADQAPGVMSICTASILHMQSGD